MKIIILADSDQRIALDPDPTSHPELIWINDFNEFLQYLDADAFIDLLFEKHESRISTLQRLKPKLVILNSVEHTLHEVDQDFIRINGWKTFLDKEIIEASGNDAQQLKAAEVFSLLGKKLLWLPDQPGFVTPRVISMIINEALLLLAEGSSTREDIDLAMKLGTNYPHGPFKWAELIGEERVRGLIRKILGVSYAT